MNVVTSMWDGLQNVVANLGTSRDKATGSAYALALPNRHELLAAYRTSDVARNIVDMPAEDSCREWREWQAEANQITLLEAEEKRLGMQGKILEARKRARLCGGAAIYIGTGEINAAMPLNPETVRRGGIRYLTVLDRWELTAKEMQLDPRLDGYGLPTAYTLQGNQGGLVEVHPSRLIIFKGNEIPDGDAIRSWYGWGDSSLTATIEKVKHLDATVANVASLVFEAKIDVINIEGLMEKLRDGGQNFETELMRRLSLAAMAKGNNGTLILDGKEVYSQKNASFSQLPEVIDRFMQVVSGASGIPMTRLFGMSPGGLNATGDADLRNYYDRVRTEQTMEMEPAMSVADECLIRSALGARPENIHYNWRPLWQPTSKERADTGKIIAETFKIIEEMDVLPREALGNAIVNGLTESGLAPGLEGDVEEFGGVNPVEPDEDELGLDEPIEMEPTE